MSYTLRGVIGPGDAVRSVGEDLGQAVVQLKAGWWLMPWSPDAFDMLGPSDEDAEVAGLHYCHSTLASALQTASAFAPVAYVEAECWAGQCEHGAVVFKAGEPSFVSDFGPILPPRPGRPTPISEALARIGVEVGDSVIDEFDSVGLGVCRHAEDWVLSRKN